MSWQQDVAYTAHRGRWLWLPFLVTWVSAGICEPGQANVAREYEAKAALVYNVAKFTAWPDSAFPSANAPFIFAVLGDDPFGGALRALEGKSMHGRRIEVRNFPTATDWRPCQVMYCKPDDLKLLIEKFPSVLSEHHLLTVGEIDGFLQAGGMLELTVSEDHLAFQINIATSRRAGLELSASLLKLADNVITE